MEIARLTAICRKSDCGPLENELVRLRAEIATLEDRKADLEEGRDNYESQYALMVKQLARKDGKLEAAEKENGDLDSKNVELQSKNGDLKTEILEMIKSQVRACLSQMRDVC
jgi:chromosome segregation ATPase